MKLTQNQILLVLLFIVVVVWIWVGGCKFAGSGAEKYSDGAPITFDPPPPLTSSPGYSKCMDQCKSQLDSGWFNLDQYKGCIHGC